MFTVKKGFLFKDGKQVNYKPTPNKGGAFTPEYLIMHYTAATQADGTISWFLNKKSEVSAHLLIDRRGNVTQFAPFDVVTWHAGRSEWKGEKFLNDNAIGIEFVNGGLLDKNKDGKFICPFDNRIVTDYKMAANVRGLVGTWQLYTPEQINAGIEVMNAITSEYKIKEVIGHEDVSPGRKTDPGPLFPWKQFKNSINSITTTAVNLRDGYSTAMRVLQVVQKGTPVKKLSELNGWSLVEVQDLGKIKGWMNSKYIR